MKLRRPWMIRLLAFLASWLIRWWMGGIRLRFVSEGEIDHPPVSAEQRFIYSFWHEALLVGTTQSHIPQTVLISNHADGELIARVCLHLGIRTARGSKGRKGEQGLRDMIRASKTTHLTISPDGPRGPRRKVQLGVIALASMTGLPIVPVGFGFANAWRLNSWDKFALPKPGSILTGVFGKEIRVPRNLSRKEMRHYKELVEREMLRLTELAEEWARKCPPNYGKAEPTEESVAMSRAA